MAPITKYVLVDLDGTVCDCSHRIQYAQAKEWDEFHSRLLDDLPIASTVELIRIIAFAANAGWPIEILGVTGRNDIWRNMTIQWLQKHEVPIDDILMRPEGDFTPDGELKIRMVEEYLGQDREGVLRDVLFAIEDRDRVVEAYRAYGIECWQVAEGKY